MPVEGSSSEESVGSESGVRGYNDEVFEVSSDSHSLGLNFSSSIDLLAIEGSSDILPFLSQLQKNMGKKVGGSVVALMVATIAETGTSTGAFPQPKKRSVLKEKYLPPPITLLGYMWVDGEVCTYFSIAVVFVLVLVISMNSQGQDISYTAPWWAPKYSCHK